jgi:hypothetical protein
MCSLLVCSFASEMSPEAPGLMAYAGRSGSPV